MALDLSAFSVILLAQNQACSDSKQDSRADICDQAIWREGKVELFNIGVLLLLDAMGLCNVNNWRGVNRE